MNSIERRTIVRALDCVRFVDRVDSADICWSWGCCLLSLPMLRVDAEEPGGYGDPEYDEAISQLRQELARSPARAAISATTAPSKNPANYVDAFWWGATYKSWLSKKSGTVGAGITSVRRNWNKRYFAIGAMGYPNRISWAKNPGKEVASEYVACQESPAVLKLASITCQVADLQIVPNCHRYVELDHNTILIEDDERKGKKLRFCVQTQGRELWLEANSKSDKKDWLAVIKAVINGADMEADD